MSDCWYALHVKPRFEKFVSVQLEQKGYETLLPVYISRRKWSDRTKSLALPLFPGYIFSRFNVNARLPIVTTPGVMTILGVGRMPAPVDECEMAAIRHVVASGLHAEPCPYLLEGDRVRVECGPLAGLTGIVARLKGRDRLIVSISLLLRSISVEIDRRVVKPLHESPREAEILTSPISPDLSFLSTRPVR